MVRPVSPSVICFANATSLVRGSLFPLAPSDEGRFPLSGGNVERSETKGVGTLSSAARLGGEIAPVSL